MTESREATAVTSIKVGTFVRAARDAARQSLFFVDLLRPVAGTRWGGKALQEAIDRYRPVALEQVCGLIRRVRPPENGADDLTASWEQLETAAEGAAGNAGGSEESVARLRERLEMFLVASRTSPGKETLGAPSLDWVARLMTTDLPNALRYLRRHLSLAVMTVFVVAVAAGVDPVWGLLRNEGREVFLCIVLMLLPWGYHHLRSNWRKHRGGAIHPWNVGFEGFVRLRPLAAPPGRGIPRWPAGIDLRRALVKQQAIRFAAFLFGAVLILLVLQQLLGILATVPIILGLFWAMLLLANQLDLWDYLLPGPVRLMILGVVVVCVTCLSLGLGNGAFIALFLVGAALVTLYNRLREKPLRSPSWLWVAALVVAAVGLAFLDWREDTRAWGRGEAAEEVNRLGKDEWPASGDRPVVIMLASGGGSRSAVYTALTLEALEALEDELGEVAEHLQLISSVSGGSLASAVYTARMAGCGHKDLDLQRAVRQDFLRPTLLGAIHPLRSRSQTIEAAWREPPVGLEGCTLGELAGSWRNQQEQEKGRPPFPVPMFNSTTLDGHNVVISPLAKEHYVDQDKRDAARRWANEHNGFEDPGYRDDPLTWVYHRDGIYGLEDLLGNRDLYLSQAVRASANFPFGFPVVRVDVAEEHRKNLLFQPLPLEEKAQIQLTDGGALSNSGMWPLYGLLMNRADDLRKRGVLLIVVEASKMPSYRGPGGSFNNLVGTIGDQGGIGRNLHQRMLDALELKYGDALATVQLDLVPRENFNVFTTWALDSGSVQRLEESFDLRWCGKKGRIRQMWTYLEARGSQATSPPVPDVGLIDRERPPLIDRLRDDLPPPRRYTRSGPHRATVPP